MNCLSARLPYRPHMASTSCSWFVRQCLGRLVPRPRLQKTRLLLYPAVSFVSRHHLHLLFSVRSGRKDMNSVHFESSTHQQFTHALCIICVSHFSVHALIEKMALYAISTE